MENKHFEMWKFFNREVAKLNTMISIYDQIFIEILDKGKKNEKFLYLIPDSFTRSIATSIYKFFDEREDSWSLYKLTTQNRKLDIIKKEIENFTLFRHKSIAHLDLEYKHNDNFDYFTKYSIEKLKIQLKKINSILDQINEDKNYNASFYGDYVDLEESFQNFKDLYLSE